MRLNTNFVQYITLSLLVLWKNSKEWINVQLLEPLILLLIVHTKIQSRMLEIITLVITDLFLFVCAVKFLSLKLMDLVIPISFVLLELMADLSYGIAR